MKEWRWLVINIAYCWIHGKIVALIQNFNSIVLHSALLSWSLSIDAEFNSHFNGGLIVSVFQLATAGSDAAIIAVLLDVHSIHLIESFQTVVSDLDLEP